MDENRIREIVAEEIRKYVDKLTEGRKLDLDKIFDLTKIPKEELDKQYYDISLVHSVSGYGSKLFKGDGKNYITENDDRVTPAVEVRREILRKYNFSDWQFVISDRGHDIQICICIADIGNAVDEIEADFRQMGYFKSNYMMGVDADNRRWVKMQFEPIYQRNESDEILQYGDLYHLTLERNVENILRNGLEPRSENALLKYPDRIFMFIGNTPFQEIQGLGHRLFSVDKREENNGVYALLKIDSRQLRDGYELYHDPNYIYGVFTDKPIPPNFISVVTTFKYS